MGNFVAHVVIERTAATDYFLSGAAKPLAPSTSSGQALSEVEREAETSGQAQREFRERSQISPFGPACCLPAAEMTASDARE